MRESPFQFLRLQNGGKASSAVQASIPQRHMREKLADALASGPAVLVVRNEDLPAVLTALGDRAVDRGTKHPAVSLARLAGGQKGIPVIRGSYTSAGQMLRSMRRLLLHAVRRGESSGCVIGVAEPIFEQVWKRGGVNSGAGKLDGSYVRSDAQARNGNLLRMLLPDAEPEDLAERLAGTSPHIRLVRQLILRAAKTRQTVLLLGDMGTGKNVAAHAIHDLTGGPGNFVKANCIALAAGRFDAELFGEVLRSGNKGRPVTVPGSWQQAGEGGTLYLDEVSALSFSQQAQLNDALRTRVYRQPGGRTAELPNAQVIVSSSRDLGSLTRTGDFLADLFYRLREFTIHTPPLRDRPEDIPILARGLWTELAGAKAQPLPESVLAAFQPYPWPGNVRELKSVLSSLHTLLGGVKLRPEHVTVLMAGQGYAPPSDSNRDRKQEQEVERMQHVRHLLRAEEVVQSLLHALCPAGAKHRAIKHQTTDAPTVESVGRLLAELELLFFNPALFGSLGVYTLMNALKGKVHYFHNLLASDRDAALRFLNNDLTDALGAVLTILRTEISRLLA